MKPSPMKQNPALALLAWVSMLCLLLLALTPAASAARMHGSHRAARRMRWMPRVENGIVTDGDGIIGNSARGADHTRRAHTTPHTPHPPRPAHRMTGSDIPADPIPDPIPPQSGADDGLNVPTDESIRPDAHDGSTVDDTDGNIANDTEKSPATDGASNATDTADGATAADDGTVGRVVPWILVILVLLAAVLIALSLMPKRKRNS